MRKENTDQEHAKFNLLDNCFNVIRGLFAIAIPLTIINIMFASYYAWIYGNQYSYGPHDWQRCLVAPNTGTTMDTQQFTVSAASFAGRGFIFIIISFKMAYIGLMDPDVLPYSIFVTIMSLLGILIYREANPIQPQPSELSSTLLTLTTYIHKGMYDSYSTSRNPFRPLNCGPAYRLNYWFLVSQYMVLVVIFLVLCLVIYATINVRRLGQRWVLQLKGNWIPLILAIFALAGYITCFISKEIVAQQTLSISGTIFPFRQSELDIVSITMMMTLGAVGVGSCKGDLEKIRMGAFVAYLHAALSYPSVLSTFNAYDSITFPSVSSRAGGISYSLWNVHQCVEYSKAKNPHYNIFSFDDLAPICRQLPVTLMGEMVQFVSCHLIALSCIYILYLHRDQPRRRGLRASSYAHGDFFYEHSPLPLEVAGVTTNQPLPGYTKRYSRSPIGRWWFGSNASRLSNGSIGDNTSTPLNLATENP